MSKVQFGMNPYSVSAAQIRGAKINAIKMELARVNAQAQMGLIPQDEAQMKIAALESKLSEVEFAPAQEVAPAMAPQEQTPAANNSDFSQNDNTDFAQHQDTFFQQQANYNRAFHNI